MRAFSIERLKRLIDEAIGYEIPFEFAHRRAITHKSQNEPSADAANQPIEVIVIGAWEVYVENKKMKSTGGKAARTFDLLSNGE
jgi:hypothetical protein